MYFVSGITGKVGGAAARHLLAQGKTIRTLARNPQKAVEWSEKGADVRAGDWNDASALADALHGVEGAYLMMPPIMTPSPDFREAKALAAVYQQALAQTPPPRLVCLSSWGSEQPSGLGLITSTHIMEQALADLPFPTAFIRAGGFLENSLGTIPAAAATGVLYTFNSPTSRPVLTIATEDIGKQVATLLTGPGWTGKKIVELGTNYSPDDFAQALTEVLSRPVQAQAVPRERWTATIEGFGIPPGASGPYEEMMDAVNSGWIHSGLPGTEPVPATTTPLQFFGKAPKNQAGH